MIKYYIEPQSNFDITFEQKTQGAAGFDLHACIGTPRDIPPGARFVIPVGIYLAMPRGVEAQVRPRSGMVRDFGVGPLQGTVDSDYRGEIKVTLFNFNQVELDEDGKLIPRKVHTVHPGDRIGQLVFAPYYPQSAGLQLPHDVELKQVMDKALLGDTGRGTSGYGSTGR